jgi:hypothetical protein
MTFCHLNVYISQLNGNAPKSIIIIGFLLGVKNVCILGPGMGVII